MHAERACGRELFLAENNSSAREIIGGKGDFHPVSRDNADVVFPHLSRKVGKDDVPILQLDPEHGVGKRFFHFSVDFNGLFLRQ